MLLIRGGGGGGGAVVTGAVDTGGGAIPPRRKVMKHRGLGEGVEWNGTAAAAAAAANLLCRDVAYYPPSIICHTPLTQTAKAAFAKNLDLKNANTFIGQTSVRNITTSAASL